jgi:hypothetical protein
MLNARQEMIVDPAVMTVVVTDMITGEVIVEATAATVSVVATVLATAAMIVALAVMTVEAIDAITTSGLAATMIKADSDATF